FLEKNLSTRARSRTARSSCPASHSAYDDVAFSSTVGVRHLGIRPVSQLNTWPVFAPVIASRRPSRDAAHHSGSGRMAGPYPMGDFTSFSLPAFLAHSAAGPKAEVAPVAPDVPSTPESRRRQAACSGPFCAHTGSRR